MTDQRQSSATWKICLCSAFCTAHFVFVMSAYAEEESSSRVVPEESRTQLLRGSTLSFGTFHEVTQYRTARRYEGEGLGISAAFDQTIRHGWAGGLQVRWSDWTGKQSFEKEIEAGNAGIDQKPEKTISPLHIVSRITGAPDLTPYIGRTGRYLTVFGSGGLGYTQFYRVRGFPTSPNKAESSDMTFIIGGGVKLIWPAGAGIRISVDRWRSLRTFSYSAFVTQLEVFFGDVEAR